LGINTHTASAKKETQLNIVEEETRNSGLPSSSEILFAAEHSQHTQSSHMPTFKPHA
jgi:hypothetical protein